MPDRDVILRQQLAECKVIEDDENVHSRQQRQIDILAKEVMYLLKKVRELS